MSVTATRATDSTLPVTILSPLHDDCGFLALVPGDWTRGRAIAAAAKVTETRFIDWRARRAYFRWAHHASVIDVPGWAFVDGVLTPCEKTETGAERYWEVVRV